MQNIINRVCLLLLLAVSFSVPQANAEETWLLIDTYNLVLLVMEGDRITHSFNDISIGRYGAAYDKVQGDNLTPLGTFRIGWITDKSRFHRFMGLNYPNADTAQRGYERGLIDDIQRRRIHQALNAGQVPPQTTILGGMIGIHGTGQGDLEVHGQFNWTNGCVALTNEEIDLLSKWVRIGTRVEIQ